ncbi:MAG: rhomboid family intramembrane serine protease [Pseudomonadota bacterium]
MFDPNANAAPFNKMPLAVLVVIALVGGMELIIQGAESGIIRGQDGMGLRTNWAQFLGFSLSIYEPMWITKSYDLIEIYRLFTFGFIQHSLSTALVALAIFAALGKYVAENFGQLCFLLLTFVAPIIGLLVYIALIPSASLIIGLFPAVFAMVGGFTCRQIDVRRETGEALLPAFTLIGFFMAVQLFFFVAFDGSFEWVAHFFAFVVGFTIANFFGPLGRSRRNSMIRVLRNR